MASRVGETGLGARRPGRAAPKAGPAADAAKCLQVVGLLCADDALVPPIMAETIRILDELGRKEDASSIRDDLVATYPESKEAADVKRSTPEAAK